MKATSIGKRRAYLLIGTLGIALACGYLGLSLRLPMGDLTRPGAGVFPIMVGVIFIIASITTLWEGLRLEKAEQVELPAAPDQKRLLALVAMMVGYIFTLPWLGQAVGGTIFCLLLMRLLSDTGWVRAGIYSLLMSGSLYFVFLYLLKIPMPAGLFGQN